MWLKILKNLFPPFSCPSLATDTWLWLQNCARRQSRPWGCFLPWEAWAWSAAHPFPADSTVWRWTWFHRLAIWAPQTLFCHRAGDLSESASAILMRFFSVTFLPSAISELSIYIWCRVDSWARGRRQPWCWGRWWSSSCRPCLWSGCGKSWTRFWHCARGNFRLSESPSQSNQIFLVESALDWK